VKYRNFVFKKQANNKKQAKGLDLTSSSYEVEDLASKLKPEEEDMLNAIMKI